MWCKCLISNICGDTLFKAYLKIKIIIIIIIWTERRGSSVFPFDIITCWFTICLLILFHSTLSVTNITSFPTSGICKIFVWSDEISIICRVNMRLNTSRNKQQPLTWYWTYQSIDYSETMMNDLQDTPASSLTGWWPVLSFQRAHISF